MKKSIMVLALTALLTIILTGTAMAEDFQTRAWDTHSVGVMMQDAVQTQPHGQGLVANFIGMVKNITSHPIGTSFGCHARVEFSIKPLFELPIEGVFVPKLCITFSL